jgi:hypothetical protein
MSLVLDIESAIERLGKWIAGEFSAAEKVYNELSDDEKKSANWAYGVIAVVNANVDKDASIIIPIIQLKYPDLSLDVIHGFIEMVLNDINGVQGEIPLTLEDAINSLAKYLGSLKGEAWKVISQGLGSLIAVLFSPETPVQKFVSIAELVYQALVKSHVAS